MSHKSHRKRSKRLKRRIKHIAAAVAGAAILSSAMIPGLPSATAHASANPSAAEQPTTVVQQVVKTPTGFHTRSVKVPQPAPTAAPAAEQGVHKAPLKGVVHHKHENKVNKDKAEIKTENKTENKTEYKAENQDQGKVAPAGDNAPANFQQVLDIKATAYAPGPHDNEQWGNKTFLGTTVRPGVIAVDPDVIPLGSRVYIQFPDGSGQYAVAEDTGGAIKGNRIDIAMSSVDQAQKFGIQNVKVYVLGKA